LVCTGPHQLDPVTTNSLLSLMSVVLRLRYK